jgi:hypothetical protein
MCNPPGSSFFGCGVGDAAIRFTYLEEERDETSCHVLGGFGTRRGDGSSVAGLWSSSPPRRLRLRERLWRRMRRRMQQRLRDFRAERLCVVYGGRRQRLSNVFNCRLSDVFQRRHDDPGPELAAHAAAGTAGGSQCRDRLGHAAGGFPLELAQSHSAISESIMNCRPLADNASSAPRLGSSFLSH